MDVCSTHGFIYFFNIYFIRSALKVANLQQCMGTAEGSQSHVVGSWPGSGLQAGSGQSNMGK